ncbi:MAG: cobalamin biosynthesis protein CobD [Lachnospiraceae bacterium]|nr:cobalamin biosynthesis protein CobD [Lachnospiraceae bacterium]
MSDIKYYFLSHIIAFVLGFFLDLIVGDPHWLYHPVRIIGALISLLEKIFLGDKKKETDTKDNNKKIAAGLFTVIIVLTLTLIICSLLVVGAYFINIYLGLFIEVIMTYFILATKSLKVESMKVYKSLEKSTLEDARKAVSMIVGRDTENLSEEGVVKAAVETVAENTSDGVIAPMIFTCIGGPILGFLYKAVNTMDSMIGYKNDRFLYFGRVAAKLDDIVNFIPARISALLMILASLLGGKNYSFRNAIKIFKRDRYNHASPNSAQTESVCAGALSVRLAGDVSYFGKVVIKPYIGDDIRSIERDDIKRICRLMYITAFICMIICTSLMLVAWEIIWLRG